MKKKLPSIPSLLKKAQKLFNAHIRRRDTEDGDFFQCISCSNIYTVDFMDAGHYVPVKGGSSLRLDENNTHGECKKCNAFDQFHLIGYRKNLIKKIGLDAVEELESRRNEIKKWTRTELIELIEKYKAA